MKRIMLLLVVSSMLFILAGCADTVKNDNSDTVNETYPTVIKNEEKYVAIYPSSAYEYFTDHKIGFFQAGKELGVETEYLGPQDNNIYAMIECMEEAISQKVSGIVLFGAGEELAPYVDKAYDAGIPVVTVDGDISNCKRIAFVGTGNFKAGKIGGEIAVKELNGSGKVIIFTEPELELHAERTRGYMSVFDQYPDITVESVIDTKTSTEECYWACRDYLEEHDDIDLIVCTDYFGGPAVAAALTDMNLGGRIKVIAMDRSEFLLDNIASGVVSTTLVQQTALMPYYAMRILYDYNNPPISIVPDRENTGVTGVPEYIETGVYVINQQNYEYFKRN